LVASPSLPAARRKILGVFDFFEKFSYVGIVHAVEYFCQFFHALCAQFFKSVSHFSASF
jgi:hypothetical protein